MAADPIPAIAAAFLAVLRDDSVWDSDDWDAAVARLEATYAAQVSLAQARHPNPNDLSKRAIARTRGGE